jgi:patatin-like phospholipase/acyl hydrolase
MTGTQLNRFEQRLLNPPINPVDQKGLCLLSLDGGGVKGLSSLYILQMIMTGLNRERELHGLARRKPCEVFDLTGGTSTGG